MKYRLLCLLVIIVCAFSCYIPVSAATTVVSDWQLDLSSDKDMVTSGGTLKISGILNEVDNSDFVVVAHRLLYGLQDKDGGLVDVDCNKWVDFDYDYDFSESGTVDVVYTKDWLSSTLYKIATILNRGKWQRVTKEMVQAESVRLQAQDDGTFSGNVPYGVYVVVVYNATKAIYNPIVLAVGIEQGDTVFNFVNSNKVISNFGEVDKSLISIEQYVVPLDTVIDYSLEGFDVTTDVLSINLDGGTSEQWVRFISRVVVPDYSLFDTDDLVFNISELSSNNLLMGDDLESLDNHVSELRNLKVYLGNTEYALDTIGFVSYYHNAEQVDESKATSFSISLTPDFLIKNRGRVLSIVYDVCADFSDIFLTSGAREADLDIKVYPSPVTLDYTSSIMEYNTNMNGYALSTVFDTACVLDWGNFGWSYSFQKIQENGNYIKGVTFIEYADTGVAADISATDEVILNEYQSDEWGYVTVDGKGYNGITLVEDTPAGYIDDGVSVNIIPMLPSCDDMGYTLSLKAVLHTNDGIDEKEYGCTLKCSVLKDDTGKLLVVYDDEYEFTSLKVMNRKIVLPDLPVTGGVGTLVITILPTVLLGLGFIIFVRLRKGGHLNA